MSNLLKVTEQQAIESLAARGWSQRRIARELKVNRRTVRRYAGGPECTISITGSSDASADSKCTIVVTGSPEAEPSKCTISTLGTPGRRSQCEQSKGIIEGMLELGLHAQRIYTDLKQLHGFTGSYQSVRRFVAKLKAKQPARIWRLESQPGEEMQVDFGMGPFIDGEQGKRRRTWVFRVVLSNSRRGYSEAVLRQDTETFLRCIENALRHFGGVPLLLNVDNLKAAILSADWFDPEVNPKLAEFCRHYGLQVFPCRPYSPQHKGKVERGIAYVKDGALKGRSFHCLAEINSALRHWEEHIADQRIHGTTRRQVLAQFMEEKPHLQPMPKDLFPAFQEAQRKVHRDSYVEVAKAYYAVPPEYIGAQLWVRWDSRTVRVLNQKLQQVAMHVRLEPGSFSHKLGTGGLNGPVIKSCHYWIDRVSLYGDACREWAQRVYKIRGVESLRAIMGLQGLIKKHAGAAINLACQSACKHGAYRLRDLRHLLESSTEQTQFEFTGTHPLIRDLKDYSAFIQTNNDSNQHDQHTQTTHP